MESCEPGGRVGDTIEEWSAGAVAARILDALFGGDVPASTEPAATGGVGEGAGGQRSAFRLTAFQEEAVRRARNTMARCGGVLLADAVGLGKTFVGLRLIEEEVAVGGQCLVVVPASLRRTWTRYLSRIQAPRSAVEVVSHTRLSRGGAAPGYAVSPTGSPSSRLVVVDEAHRFRNPATRRYGALARCIAEPASGGERTRVLLITATPINNRATDLYHLLRLFAPDDALVDVGIPSLGAAFEDDGPEPGSSALHRVVRELVIRRTRGMILDRYGASAIPAVGGARFPSRSPPVVLHYAAERMPRMIAEIGALELAPYRDTGGGSAGARGGPEALVRLGLVKRLESSPAAAMVSLRRLRGHLELCLEAIRCGRVPPYGGHTGFVPDGDPLQLAMPSLLADPASPDVDLRALAGSVEGDLERVDRILADAASLKDVKVAALRQLLDTLRPEPVLVFTEFRDTARYLARLLARHTRVGRIDGSGAWLGHHRTGRRAVVERFAPIASGRPAPRAREAVVVLIATDVVAEGLNLQDARHVVSFDLPWNPVRLLQRIGRVDRLGSLHDTVEPYLFAPDRGLDAVLGLTGRLQAKLDGIVTALGEEGGDELLRALATDAARIPALLSAVDRGRDDPMESLRTLWLRLRERRSTVHQGPSPERRGRQSPERNREPRPPQPPERPRDPAGSAIVAAVTVAPGRAVGIAGVVLLESGGVARLVEVTADGRARDAGAPAVAAICRALETPPLPPAARISRDRGETAGIARIAVQLARAEAAAGPRPGSAARHDPAARLARQLRSALWRAGSAIDPELLQRSGAILARLDRPLPPPTESAARQLLAELRGGSLPPPDLVDRIERTIEGNELVVGGASSAAASGRARRGGEPTVLAVLRIRIQEPDPVDAPTAHD